MNDSPLVVHSKFDECKKEIIKRKDWMHEVYVNGFDISWQDYISGRADIFLELAAYMHNEGMLPSGKTVYLPAANSQLETSVFGRMFPDVRFIGGDILSDNVLKGKARLGGNDDIHVMIADAYYAPLKTGSINAVIDFCGALWHAGVEELYIFGRYDFVRSLFCEYHRILARGGFILLDDYDMEQCDHPSTISRIKDMSPENASTADCFTNALKAGHIEFESKGYRAKFDIKPYDIADGRRIYTFSKTE